MSFRKDKNTGIWVGEGTDAGKTFSGSASGLKEHTTIAKARVEAREEGGTVSYDKPSGVITTTYPETSKTVTYIEDPVAQQTRVVTPYEAELYRQQEEKTIKQFTPEPITTEQPQSIVKKVEKLRDMPVTELMDERGNKITSFKNIGYNQGVLSLGVLGNIGVTQAGRESLVKPSNRFVQQESIPEFYAKGLAIQSVTPGGVAVRTATKAIKVADITKQTIKSSKPVKVLEASKVFKNFNKFTGTTKTGRAVKKVSDFTIGAGKQYAVGRGTFETFQFGKIRTLPNELKEQIYNDKKAFAKEFAQAKAAETKAAKGETWYKRLAYEIPVIDLWAGDKRVFTDFATTKGKDKGLAGNDLKNYVKALEEKRKAASYGTGLAFVGVEATSEFIGAKSISSSFKHLMGTKSKKEMAKMSGSQLFLRGAKDIAPVGFSEGFVQESIIQKGRGEKQDYKKSLTAGGIGAVSAGLFGGAVVATSVKKSAAKPVIETIGYIIDPYELPGDLTAKALKGTAKGFKGVPIPTFLPSFASTETKKDNLKTKKQPRPKARGNKFTHTFSYTPVSTKTMIPSTTAPTMAQTEAFVGIPTDIIGQVPSDVPTKVPTDIPAIVDVPTNTNINTNIFTNVPAISPQFRIPPPIPLMFPTGNAGASSRVGKRKKYVDEVKESRRLLNKLIGYNAIKVNVKPAKKVKAKKPKLVIKSKMPKTNKDDEFLKWFLGMGNTAKKRL